MCATRMRPDEVEIDAALAWLIAGQFPGWAGLPVRRLRSSGTENAMFRLGTDLVVRLPRYPGAVESVAHEQRRLPRLRPPPPFASPEPLGLEAGDLFGWPWSVYRWLDGANPVAGALDGAGRLAEDLAAYITALRGIDAADGPAGPGRFRRRPGTRRHARRSRGWRVGATPMR
ncbi:phosphotransferase [Streptomyces sp. GD-15H]